MTEEIKNTELESEEGSVETPEEEASQKTSSEGEEPEKKSEEMSQEEKSKLAAFDRIYAERKELKEKVKQLEEELKKYKEKENLPPEEKEIEKIVEITSALSGLDDEEKKELLMRARAKGISLSEARKDPNFLLWQQARREKVEKEKKQLEPSTRVSPSKVPIEKIPIEELKNLTPEEREKWYIAHGIKRKPIGR